ncbi:methyltransferase, putative [Talaromyces stipitatus ATCC 10500]|uniref:Methyltransferase, putative n=1 Tax=Talaromyces stipitatus (strain ATCC 10500 / CBS 375.48 / QM 6759 / NRRL 1006) TaxID=441959 RepID=B8MSY8_TALSN|nr:methyltransferase, putative [Talaromyces stipitatus ATCC 10500]EED12144.1 methyltransferase, putative [Talaromyces stipitatus ATCC 10500]
MAIVHRPTWLQSYAKYWVVRTLTKIQRGRATFICRYEDDATVVVGEKDTAVPDELNATIYVVDPNFWVRFCTALDLGLSEAFMLQEIECPDLNKIFNIYFKNKDYLGFGNPILQAGQRLSRLLWSPSNDVQQARLNASAHYDTSNELFAAFLSPDMNYSCAHWTADPAETLQTAQERKVDTLLKKLRLTSNHHMLEIGCGWGDVMVKAAQRYSCRVTGITLSSEQKELVEQKIKNAKLDHLVSVLLCDYRTTPVPDSGYDRVISIGMFEHVGRKYLNEYFSTISRLLNPTTGLLVLDGITFTNKMHESRSPVDTFIGRYIFPGGYLPSIHLLTEALHKGSKGTLEITYAKNIGPHYGKTLLAWRDNFLRNWDRIMADYMRKHPSASKEDIEAFRRMWLYYFLSCEAGFRSRALGNYVICAARTPEPAVPYTSAGFQEMLD